MAEELSSTAAENLLQAQEDAQMQKIDALKYSVDALEEAESAQREVSAASVALAGAHRSLERLESVKAASCGALSGTFIALSGVVARNGTSGLSIASVFDLSAAAVCSSLVCIVYRYAVRQDKDTQLKLGAAAAVGLARAFGECNGRINACGAATSECFANAALSAGESMLPIIAATLTVETLMQRGFIASVGAPARTPAAPPQSSSSSSSSISSE